MRRLAVVLSLVFAVLAGGGALAGAALAALPPVVQTQPPTGVGQTQATLVAQVNPEGSATTVRFDVGTTTSYGLQSSSKDAGSGTSTVTIQIPVQGLTPATTYHVRAVATSAGGTATGADLTFTTAVAPKAPTVSTGGVRSVTTTSATLTGWLNPQGAATTYHFEYGRTTAYGSATPTADAGAGTSGRNVSAAIGGLTPGKRYHYRLVASNALGTVRGGDRSFVAAAYPTSASLSADVEPVTYGHAAVLRGRLGGPKIAGVRVRLQTTPFPFSAPFADTGAAVHSSRTGTYTFTLPLLTVTTRAVVIADGVPPVLSPVVVVRCAVRAGITAVHRAGRHAVVVSGRVIPATPNGTASLQRLAPDGRWVPLRRVHLGPDGRYAITVRRRHAPMLVHVVGVAHDGGAHVRGTSRAVRIRAL